MFSFFVYCCFCTWWDFNESEWPKLRDKSQEKPILVICYSHHCPHCSGLPEGTKQFSDGIGNRTDFYVTMLDCAENANCKHFKISGTPHMTLVVGKKHKYWPRIYSRDGKDWIAFIDSYLYSKPREITTNYELEKAKIEPMDGGTTFHLETPSTEGKLFEQFSKLTRMYKLYNDTFTYRINKSLNQSSLTAYLSPHCSLEYDNILSLDKFVELHKFGALHHYDGEEYKLINKKTPSVVITIGDDLLVAQRNALWLYSNKFCGKIAVGYASTKKSNMIQKEMKFKSISDLPLIVYYNSFKQCRSFGKMRALTAIDFIQKAHNLELCGQYYTGKIGNSTLSEKSNGNKNNIAIPQIIINGSSFILSYFLTGFAFIIVLRAKGTFTPGKNE